MEFGKRECSDPADLSAIPSPCVAAELQGKRQRVDLIVVDIGSVRSQPPTAASLRRQGARTHDNETRELRNSIDRYLTVARAGYNHRSFKQILDRLFLPQRQLDESPVASFVYCTDDGSQRFILNINWLRCGVCKSCARTCIAVLPSSTLECDVAMGHARYSLTRECSK
jgi:hypothetical protein